jgi:hypothetical protein
MNWRAKRGVKTAAVILAAGISVSAFGGDAIIVPGGSKGKAAPAPESQPAPREVFRLRDTAPANPFDVLSVPVMPDKKRLLDPKEEKMRRLQQLEKRNWMIVQDGELQAEEEKKGFLDVREYSLDEIEKQDESGNLMFRRLSKDDNRRVPGQFRDPNRDPVQRDITRAAEDESEHVTLARPDKDPQMGAHMSSELNFKALFEPRQAGADSLSPRFNKSELTLQSLLNSGTSTENAREQQARRDEFRNFLNKPSTPLAGPSDPINSRDFTREPLNPTTPAPFAGNTLGSAPTFNRLDSLPRSTFGSPRPAAGFAAGSLLSPDAGRAQRPVINFEPPKRKF